MSAIDKFIKEMREEGRSNDGHIMQVALKLQAEEQAHKPMAPAGLMEEIYKVNDEGLRVDFKARVLDILSRYTPQEEKPAVDGNTSDGYHTFNELYDHRIALYLDIVAQNSEWFWKAKKHEDGSEFKGWFILGGNMGTGDISYHLPMDKWELAKCKELPFGKKWDGHMPKDVVERITRHSQAPNTSRPANADMVETEFGEWLRIMSENASYSDQRELLRVVLKHYKESHPVKAPADEGLVEIKKIADMKFREALDYAKRTECLGWEYKSKNGLFGIPEFKAHEKVNTLIGEEKGLYLALEILSRHKASDKGVK